MSSSNENQSNIGNNFCGIAAEVYYKISIGRRSDMEMALQFNELAGEELYSIDGGRSAYDNGYTVGKYIGIFVTCVCYCFL